MVEAATANHRDTDAAGNDGGEGIGCDALDVFESGLASVFDEPLFALGDAGTSFTYGSICIHLPTPLAANTSLMAHYVWQSALVLSKRIQSGDIKVKDAVVIELGAGAGLVSVVAGVSGAYHVIASDFPDPSILNTLERNLKGNSQSSKSQQMSSATAAPSFNWNVVGHKWGDTSTRPNLLPPSVLKDMTGRPLHLLLSDVLWIPNTHTQLLSDLSILLSYPNSKAHISVGLHTGRETVDAFFRRARSDFGLSVKKIGEIKVLSSGLGDMERVGETDVSEDIREQEARDPTERKRWVLLYEMEKS